MTDQTGPVVSVNGARDLNPEAREAVEALIAVAKQQITRDADHDGGPSVAECAEADARWWGGEKAGE